MEVLRRGIATRTGLNLLFAQPRVERSQNLQWKQDCVQLIDTVASWKEPGTSTLYFCNRDAAVEVLRDAYMALHKLTVKPVGWKKSAYHSAVKEITKAANKPEAADNHQF